MQFIYGKAPINYIDNIPAHKAGEWPGIKSCKFHSYKRVIRPVDCGVIFNEKEPLPPPRRKLLGPKSPTPEYVFRPSCRMIPNPNKIIDRAEGLKYIFFEKKESKERPERRHDFPYRREIDIREQEKNKALKSVAGGGPDDNLPPIAKYLYEKDWTEEEEIEKEKRKKNTMGRWS